MYKPNNNSGDGGFIRVRMPREGEILGFVESRLGFGKMKVICADKKIRVCRIPGKYRRRLWVKAGYIVLVKPWEFEGDEKGDIIFVYRKSQHEVLRRKGLLDEIEA